MAISPRITAPFGGRTAAVVCARVRHLIESGVSPYSVLVLVGNRARRRSCLRELNRQGLLAGPAGAVEIQTYSGLANRTVGLFWPKLAPAAGFSRDAGARLPVMLTFETAQYLMSRLIRPLLDRGYFEGLPVRRQRILSQLLDNLNKAAVNGYPTEEVGERLQEAWAGEAGHRVYFQQAQECIDRFRAHCLEHGLVDFSLAVDLFDRFFVRSGLGPHTEPLGRYRHLVVDQLEETVPVAQDLIERLLADCDSSLLLCDGEGGGTGYSWGSTPAARAGWPPDSGSFDHFLRKLFGEVLAKEAMKPEEGALYARLINSATWFRQAVPAMGLDDRPEGRRYLDMLSEGIVSAEYQTGVGEIVSSGKVMLVAPVYTYLLHEQVSRYQFWLDVGSIFWWEPPHQPLTNPYVLSRSWERGTPWTEAEDRERRNQLLQRLVRGLCRRCLDGVFVCASEVEALGGGPQDSPCCAHSKPLSPKTESREEGGGMNGFRPRPGQREILEYAGGRMGVSAVPGSGKTAAVAALTAHLLNHQGDGPAPLVPPGGRVLVVTYQTAAADTLRVRIREQLGQAVSGRAFDVRTLHSLSYGILKSHPGQAGTSADFQVVDERAGADLLEKGVRRWNAAHREEWRRLAPADRDPADWEKTWLDIATSVARRVLHRFSPPPRAATCSAPAPRSLRTCGLPGRTSRRERTTRTCRACCAAVTGPKPWCFPGRARQPPIHFPRSAPFRKRTWRR